METLSMGELRNRIVQHAPPQPDRQKLMVKRSLSTSGLELSGDYDHLEDLALDDPESGRVQHRKLMYAERILFSTQCNQ